MFGAITGPPPPIKTIAGPPLTAAEAKLLADSLALTITLYQQLATEAESNPGQINSEGLVNYYRLRIQKLQPLQQKYAALYLQF